MITKDEILHLANLSRIKLSGKEAEPLQQDIDDIIEYVGVIQSLVLQDVGQPKCGSVYNVFREDEVSNEPGQYTEALLKEAPETKDGYLQVKQILQNDEE